MTAAHAESGLTGADSLGIGANGLRRSDAHGTRAKGVFFSVARGAQLFLRLGMPAEIGFLQVFCGDMGRRSRRILYLVRIFFYDALLGNRGP